MKLSPALTSLKYIRLWHIFLFNLLLYPVQGFTAQSMFLDKFEFPNHSLAMPDGQVTADFFYHEGELLDEISFSSTDTKQGFNIYVDHNASVYSKDMYQYPASTGAQSQHGKHKESHYAQNVRTNSQLATYHLLSYFKKMAKDLYLAQIAQNGQSNKASRKTKMKLPSSMKGIIPELDKRTFNFTEFTYEWDSKTNWATTEAVDSQPIYAIPGDLGEETAAMAAPPAAITFIIKLTPQVRKSAQASSNSPEDFEYIQQNITTTDKPITLTITMDFPNLSQTQHKLNALTVSMKGRNLLERSNPLGEKINLTRVVAFPHIHLAHPSNPAHYYHEEAHRGLHYLMAEYKDPTRVHACRVTLHPLTPVTVPRPEASYQFQVSSEYFPEGMTFNALQHGELISYALNTSSAPGPAQLRRKGGAEHADRLSQATERLLR